MDGGAHALVSAAAAQIGHGGINLGIAGVGGFVEQGSSGRVLVIGLGAGQLASR